MRIDKNTLYIDFARVEKYLTPEAVEALKKSAERAYCSMYELTLAEFIACSNGNWSEVLGDVSKPTVLQVYWCKRFADFTKEFTDTLKSLQAPLTADEQTASAGLPTQTFAESMMIFARGYFGLHSFKSAEQITIGEIVIAKRDTYINALYTRKLHNLQMKKANKQAKKK